MAHAGERLAPLFMLSHGSASTGMDSTPFVFEQVVRVEEASSNGQAESENAAYARQRALLRTWRDALDSPGQARAKAATRTSTAATRLWANGADDTTKTEAVAVRVRAIEESRAATTTPPRGGRSSEQQPPADSSPRGGRPRTGDLDATGAVDQRSSTAAATTTRETTASWAWMAAVPADRPLDYREYLAPFKSIGKCRETRALEKDERRRHAEHDEWRRRRHAAFCRALVNHRDDFFKRNKQRRNDAAKCARACKAHFEAIFHRAEVEESKAGRRRLQALRANDMEAYTKLVEETKNERLKFLLEQTDNYIVSITEKVKAQRQNEEYDEARAARSHDRGDGATAAGTHLRRSNKRQRPSSSGGGGVEFLLERTEDERRRATSEYYAMTHARVEEVRQPKMLVGGTLKEYQLAGLSWLVSLYNNRLNGILADEMGLGKTIQSIALLAHLAEEKHNFGPFMVVAPLSTLSNWANEFAKWTPDLVVLCYKGPPTARKDVQKDIQQYLTARKRSGRDVVPSRSEVGKKKPRDHDDDDGDDHPTGVAQHEKPNFSVLLTTYEYVMRDRAVLRKVDWQYIIVDEGHRMKNANSKFAQTLGNLYTAKRRLLLTGTPLQNSLPELWALLNFLLPSIFSSVDTFEGWFNKPFAQFGAASQQQALSEDGGALGHEERMLVINRLHEVLRPFVLRRVKAAVLGQLPEKIEKVIRCDLSSWQKILYEQIRSSRGSSLTTATGVDVKGGDDDADDAASEDRAASSSATTTTSGAQRGLNNVLMQLRKCCNHPYLFRTDAYRIDEAMIRASGKFLLLDAMLPKFKAAGHRVLLFSQMTAVMDLLEEFFNFRDYEYLRLDGSTPADERERRVARFNDACSPTFVFLLSTRAGGLGLNLASADTVVIFDSDWNPMMDAQAQDRAHRIGQRNDVRVFRLVAAAPVEERILARATDKLNMNSLVVEAGKFNKDSRAHERRQMLEELLKEYACEDHNGSDQASQDNGDADSSNGEKTNEAQLAETIATSADELALYTKCDAERAKHGETLRPMTLDEVPAWVKAGNDSSLEPLPAKTNDEPLFLDARHRAARKKKDTPYYDSLSERNFLKLVESGSLDRPKPHYRTIGRPGDLVVRLRLVKRTPKK
ncbi:hypothetical protein CTAYLR_007117 [Chrysophaeum taylorii]|uniref:Uncharacterized protein n=1 Tax=Chrysophaeum taylorii TaxID=2483200 RepID=A0AAD7U782_9STRA|nr:hypothetical protein CTAYLR_007117 [Chrysophaeum taylorii]